MFHLPHAIGPGNRRRAPGAKVLILGHHPHINHAGHSTRTPLCAKKRTETVALACHEISSDDPIVDGRVPGVVACNSQDLLQRDVGHERGATPVMDQSVRHVDDPVAASRFEQNLAVTKPVQRLRRRLRQEVVGANLL